MDNLIFKGLTETEIAVGSGIEEWRYRFVLSMILFNWPFADYSRAEMAWPLHNGRVGDGWLGMTFLKPFTCGLGHVV